MLNLEIKAEGTLCLKEVDSVALQSAIRNLAGSFNHFFKQQTQATRFKSKNNPVQSYTTKTINHNLAILGNQVKLPKLGFVCFTKILEVKDRILSTTVRKNASGNYFIKLTKRSGLN